MNGSREELERQLALEQAVIRGCEKLLAQAAQPGADVPWEKIKRAQSVLHNARYKAKHLEAQLK